MENHLHFEAIKKAYNIINIHIDLNKNFKAYDDVPAAIAKKVHEASESSMVWDQLENKKKERKISNAKKNLNGIAFSFMTKALLDEIDPDEDLLSWFDTMKALII